MHPHAETPWTGPAIMHVDMDAFFAAVEQLDHPEWRGRPVIVGGSPEGRGVVSTASYEARAYGVHSAMPAARAARLCPDAVWARPRFDRYHEISATVRGIFTSITPHVQMASIDEAYLDVTPGVRGRDPVAIAHTISERVAALGVTCSIGLGASKTVAKIASDAHKPNGITVVTPGEEAAFLDPLPVSALPGIGRSTRTRLHELGIITLAGLAALDDRSAVQALGPGGPDLAARARGVDGRVVRDETGRKSISAEHTFRSDIRTRAEVEAQLRPLVERVAQRTRRHGLAGRTFTLRLRYADFTTRSASRTIEVATDLGSDMLPIALHLLEDTWTPGSGLRLLGFGATGFSEVSEQLDLLADHPAGSDKERALTTEMDRIRERFGDDALGFGVRGLRASNDPEGDEDA